ncbi:MAG: hypothetical protein ABIV48_13225 [Pyrinomonadaceae bacterium]
MFRRSLISIFIAGIVFVIGNVAIFAQNAPVSGTVEMQNADGSRVPVAGALVEVFRSDIKASAPPAKTNKKGEFSFAGLQLGASFIFSVSAPNAAPTYITGVKAGQERLLITMSPGDGRKVSEEEVRKMVADKAEPGSTEKALTAEEMKKAQAEYEAEVKKVKEKNDKALKANEIINAALKAGNEAFTAKNYELAVTKYDEGIAADPDYVGSAPILYNNRGAALMSRGVDNYNTSVKNPDVSERFASFAKVKQDFADGSAGYLKSWDIIKNAPAADIVDKANFEATRLGTLRGAVDIFQMAVRTEQVDPVTIEAATVLIPEYVKVETDAAKKAAARLAMADLYRVVGDSDNAIVAYKAILETSPDDLDALAGAGLSLVNIGYIKDDKTKLQEGANLLQKYASAAPDNHKFKADAVALIDSLKKDQNVTPQKVTPVRKKP